MTKANKLKKAAAYYPGTHVPETITLSDMEIEVKEGDIAYFHYLCIQDQTYLKTEYNEKFEPVFQYYRIDYDQIFCVVRNKAIIPISGHVLAEPYYSEDVVDVSEGVKGKFYKDTDLVEEVFEKPAYLEAKLSFIGNPLGFEACNVKPGDRIFYTTFSNFENVIEGENYYVFRQWDIFGKNNEGVSEPVGAWTLIYPDKPKMFTPSGIYMPNNDKKPVNTGKVIHVGPDVEVDMINKNVQFEEKSSYIMKMPGKEMIFVHKEDFYGILD
jgi:co-chaperonin GroES (HSP10)